MPLWERVPTRKVDMVAGETAGLRTECQMDDAETRHMPRHLPKNRSQGQERPNEHRTTNMCAQPVHRSGTSIRAWTPKRHADLVLGSGVPGRRYGRARRARRLLAREPSALRRRTVA